MVILVQYAMGCKEKIMDETLCFGKENMSLLEDSQALRVPCMELKMLMLNAVS
jgi:hypothetical protein